MQTKKLLSTTPNYDKYTISTLIKKKMLIDSISTFLDINRTSSRLPIDILKLIYLFQESSWHQNYKHNNLKIDSKNKKKLLIQKGPIRNYQSAILLPFITEKICSISEWCFIYNEDENDSFLKLVKDITSKGFVRSNYQDKLIDLSNVRINLKSKK